MEEQVNLNHPRYYINRELSWLEFNARVLEEAQDPTTPLLERLKFLSIFTSNLDEFFMIRVANLRELEAAERLNAGPDGLTPVEQLDAISDRNHELVEAHTRCMMDDVLPALAEEQIHILPLNDLSDEQRLDVQQRFDDEIFAVLTPMTVDPSHPFPHLPNLSLNLFILFEREDDEESASYAIVEIPPLLPQFMQLDATSRAKHFVQLHEVIRANLHKLFPGMRIAGTWLFRLTRNADLSLAEQEVQNLLADLERELRSRAFRRVVRLEFAADMPHAVRSLLQTGLRVPERDIYEVDGILNAPALMSLYKVSGHELLRDRPFNPRLNKAMSTNESIFSILRERDVLLHHPYESFSTVVELLQRAATDPKVLAIKQTLYRTSGDSVIIEALKEAARNDKQVTALVELKARFDEKNNIVWARELEEAGCHVVYGVVGLKTHCKAAMVVRKEGKRVRRYCHLATGNYNSSTAKLYTDVGLLTADEEMGEDVSQLFNILTGYNARMFQRILEGTRPAPSFKKLYLSPFGIKPRFIELIDKEIALHTEANPGLIQAKFNSLCDPDIIEALYRASRAGVQVRLNIRGICSLRPGVPNISDNIQVVSIVDRFLEHPRIFHFRHGGQDLVYISSADWMPRNLHRRVEQLAPIEAPELKKRCINEILGLAFADNTKARVLQADGTYARVEPEEGEVKVRCQEAFIEIARDEGMKMLPYEEAIRKASHRKTRSTRRNRSLR